MFSIKRRKKKQKKNRIKTLTSLRGRNKKMPPPLAVVVYCVTFIRNGS
jgi:hypothetical protein